MPIRILIVFALVTGLHYYLGVRLITESQLPHIVQLALWALLLSLPILQVGSMVLRVQRRQIRKSVAWFAFMSLGAFWLLLIFTIARDLIWFIFQVFGAIPAEVNVRMHVFSLTSMAVVVIAALAFLISWYEARRPPRIRSVDVTLKGLPKAFEGFTIAQITDLHISDTIGESFVSSVVKKTNSLLPDIVTLTGDIVDCALDVGRQAAEHLGNFHAPAYYVTGNHEYYVGVEPWLEALDKIGLEILHNEHRVIRREDSHLVIAGVPDRSGESFGGQHKADFEQAARDAPHGVLKVLLSHQPRTARDAARAGFDLQISGHTHGGQMWPWNFLVLLQQPVVQGLAVIEGLQLWTSRGTGYWGPPLRFAAPSEISLLRLTSGTQSPN